MTFLGLVCAGLVALHPDGSSASTASVWDAYQAAKAQTGRDAEAQIRLAYWCEAHQLPAERTKHLTLALLTDPVNVTARGLLGLVAHEGKWLRPAQVDDQIKADEALSAKLSDYNRRRAVLSEKLGRTGRGQRLSRTDAARAHDKLGLWCKEIGLTAEATAHFTSAVVLDPHQDLAWRHLGYLKHNGRWMSREQIAALERDTRIQEQANKQWKPLLEKAKGQLDDHGQRAEAERALAEVTDPLAVPMTVRVFRDGKEPHETVAVRLLGQIDSTAATRELAALAIFSAFDLVRKAATEAFAGREPRDFAGMLVDMIHTPMRYWVEPVRGPGSPGALAIETPRYRMWRHYDAPAVFVPGANWHGYVGYDVNGLPIIAKGVELKSYSISPQKLLDIEARTAGMIADAHWKAAASQERLKADIQSIERTNSQAVELNNRIAPVLTSTVGAPKLSDDEDAWHTWWYDKIGYRYQAPPQVQVAVNAAPQYPPPYVTSCFVAGTPVLTRNGHRPIEILAAGDQVLSQDVTTAELSFQPILVVHHNPAGPTIRVELDTGETISASIYHRFWRRGKGWAMARELVSGDTLRTLGGLARVVSVSSGPVEPLFNLDVARSRTFFVGEHDALVHDNTLPDSRAKPFDTEPLLSPVSR